MAPAPDHSQLLRANETTTLEQRIAKSVSLPSRDSQIRQLLGTGTHAVHFQRELVESNTLWVKPVLLASRNHVGLCSCATAKQWNGLDKVIGPKEKGADLLVASINDHHL